MPQIIVMADRPNERAVLHTERVNVSDFESAHFANQLVERLGWAVGDAAELERTEPPPAPKPERPQAQAPEASVVTTAS